MAYNTPFTAYESYTELNQCMAKDNIVLRIVEDNDNLYYSLVDEDGDEIGKALTLSGALHLIRRQLGQRYINRTFMKSKIDRMLCDEDND